MCHPRRYNKCPQPVELLYLFHCSSTNISSYCLLCFALPVGALLLLYLFLFFASVSSCCLLCFALPVGPVGGCRFFYPIDRQGKARAGKARKRISDPWAGGEEEEAGEEDEDNKEAFTSTRAKAGTGDAKPLLLSPEGEEGEEGGRRGGDGFVTAPRVPGRNVKRPVSFFVVDLFVLKSLGCCWCCCRCRCR